MKGPHRLLVVAAALVALGVPAAVLCEAPADALDQNRKLLDKLRTDPEQYARLVRDLHAFNRLPAAERERLRRLDQDVQAELSSVQVRLLRAGRNYADWLRRLPPADREQITAEPDKAKRLARTKEIRRRQWLERQPRPTRERVERAAGPEREALVRRLREEERNARQDWQQAARNWEEVSRRGAPHRLDEFPPAVRQYVNFSLRPLLSADEVRRLDRATDSALFPFVLIELADRHPVVYPPADGAPTHLRDLPQSVREGLEKLPAAVQQRLREADGRWPEFALTVTAIAAQRRITLPKQLGPCRPQDYPPPWQAFIRQLAPPDTEDGRQLARAEGRWPRYHRELLALAAKRHAGLPKGVRLALPGGAARWDRYREQRLPAAASMVSDLVLREFARTELPPDERVRLGVSLDDPWNRDQLQQAFAKRHPDDWLRLQLSDEQKKMRTQSGGSQ